MPAIRRILCPVDLSEISRHALDHALAIMAWYGAKLTLLHVVHVPQPLLPAPVGVIELAGSPPPQPKAIADEIWRFSGLTDTPVAADVDVVVNVGTAAREIVRQAQALAADLLVMGTHGHSGFEALFLGSVTEKVLRSTAVPVMTVPPRVTGTGPVVYKTILCPIEFSDASTRALEYALTLAEENEARVILLHVIEALVDAPQISRFAAAPEYQRFMEEDARKRLEAAIPDEARMWCTPDIRIVAGKAYQVILETAQDEGVELIVMGVHGRGTVNRLLFGSTTHRVIRTAGCPVLTLRG